MATCQNLAYKQNVQCSGITKKLFQNKLAFSTFIFAILVDFAFLFWYEPLTLFRE